MTDSILLVTCKMKTPDLSTIVGPLGRVKKAKGVRCIRLQRIKQCYRMTPNGLSEEEKKRFNIYNPEMRLICEGQSLDLSIHGLFLSPGVRHHRPTPRKEDAEMEIDRNSPSISRCKIGRVYEIIRGEFTRWVGRTIRAAS
jgi:hypothetical protein